MVRAAVSNRHWLKPDTETAFVERWQVVGYLKILQLLSDGPNNSDDRFH
jgi:hypothetical protein